MSQITELIVELLKFSQKCDIIKYLLCGGVGMAVSYKKLLHMMIERDITNAQLMRDANISANIITKLKNGQYIALDKVESICLALNCGADDILEFIPEKPTADLEDK
jgi:putative transcriptional regulator